MKKIALGIMAMVLAFSSMAQTTDQKASENKEFHNGDRNFKGRENLEKLNLTTDQKQQIKTLNESFRQQMQDLKNNAGISTDDQKVKRRELAKEHREKIAAILTPEQRAQAEQLRSDYSENGHDKASGRFQEMTKNLNLTPEQSSKMQALNSTFRESIKSVHQNNALSPEEKKEQLKSLMKKHQADMESLLTEDQKKQLKNNDIKKPVPDAVK